MVLLHDGTLRNHLRQNAIRKRSNNGDYPSRRRQKNVKISKQLPRPTKNDKQIRSRHIQILHASLPANGSRKPMLHRKRTRRSLQKNHSPTLQHLAILFRIPTRRRQKLRNLSKYNGQLDNLKNRRTKQNRPRRLRKIRNNKSMRLHKKIHRRPLNLVYPKFPKPIQQRRQIRKKNNLLCPK